MAQLFQNSKSYEKNRKSREMDTEKTKSVHMETMEEGTNKIQNLKRLGVPMNKAWEYANTRKGYWRISSSLIVSTTLGNQYLEESGYKSITKRCQLIH